MTRSSTAFSLTCTADWHSAERPLQAVLCLLLLLRCWALLRLLQQSLQLPNQLLHLVSMRCPLPGPRWQLPPPALSAHTMTLSGPILHDAPNDMQVRRELVVRSSSL